jgi:hypothetical protein
MTIEEIVKKHKRSIRYANSQIIANSIKEDLKAAGHHVKSLVLTKNKLVIRTDNELFVETF